MIRWVQPEQGDLADATNWLELLSGQYVNFTGALSFTPMRREKTTEAFTFDRHFSFAGFQVFEALTDDR